MLQKHNDNFKIAKAEKQRFFRHITVYDSDIDSMNVFEFQIYSLGNVK